MIQILTIQTIIVIGLIILFIIEQRKLANQKIQIDSLSKNNSKLKNELSKVKQTTPIEKRDAYRIHLPKIECIVTLIDFGSNTLDALKNKTLTGFLEDISISGLRFITSYELPVKYRIIIKVSFLLNGEEFNLKGRIIRREDHIKGKSVSYGVQFIDLSVKDIRKLNVEIHNYQVANRIS